MKSKTDLKFLFRKFDINVFRGWIIKKESVSKSGKYSHLDNGYAYLTFFAPTVGLNCSSLSGVRGDGFSWSETNKYETGGEGGGGRTSF